MAHHMERSFVHCFQIKLEFRSVGSNGGRKTGEPGVYPRSKARTSNKLDPLTTPVQNQIGA